MRKIIPSLDRTFDYDDISVVPRIESISASDPALHLNTKLTQNVEIKYPFIASPMDSVINETMAVCLRKYGMLPIFYIRASNEKLIHFEIEEYSKKSDGRFGLCVPTDSEYINHVLSSRFSGVCEVIALDTLHSKPYNHLRTLEYLRKKFDGDIISGNILNAEDCQKVIDCGANAVRIGMTVNAVNKGYEMTGCGRRQASAVYECANVGDKNNIPVIADGGIKSIADVVKSIALGASTVMMGKLFAAIQESPAETIILNDEKYKIYKGMSRKSIVDEDMIPEGSTVQIKCSGKFDEVINTWIEILKVAVARSGAINLEEMRENSIIECY